MPGGAPEGNKNATKNRPWAEAINRALLAEDGKKLRALAEKLIEKALEGDVAALKEVGDRSDGKPHQSVALSGEVSLRKAVELTDDQLAEIALASGPAQT